MVIFATIWAVLYAGLIGIACGLWMYQSRNPKQLIPGQEAQEFTLIVPFRNEANHLPLLIQCLNQQTFPRQQWECIFVDDHSTDNSLLAFNAPINFKYRVIQGTGDGKKAALNEAISYASNDHIIQTDADCTCSPSWLESIAQASYDRDPTVITGPVAIAPSHTLLDHFQAMDMMALMGFTFTGIRTGWWSMGNGANMSYPGSLREDATLHMKGQEYSSGDDMFLIEHATKMKQGHIHFLFDEAAIVHTPPCPDIKSFMQQRLRWAGKNAAMSSIGLKLTLIVCLGFNILLVAIVVRSVFNHEYISITLILWMQKWMIDYFYLKILASFFKTSIPLLQYLFSAALYPFYACLISLMSIFKRNYEWKGRVTR